MSKRVIANLMLGGSVLSGSYAVNEIHEAMYASESTIEHNRQVQNCAVTLGDLAPKEAMLPAECADLYNEFEFQAGKNDTPFDGRYIIPSPDSFIAESTWEDTDTENQAHNSKQMAVVLGAVSLSFLGMGMNLRKNKRQSISLSQ